jgi:hypothetical protein
MQKATGKFLARDLQACSSGGPLIAGEEVAEFTT